MQFVPVVVADVNRDGEYEVVVWTDPPESSVVCISSQGKELWRWTNPGGGPIRMVQAMGDVDGDGSMDMAVMTDAGGYCIDIGGMVPRTKWTIDFDDLSRGGLLPDGATGNVYSSYQLIADVDGDGKLEVLWLAPFPILTDASTGSVEAYYVNNNMALGSRQ